MPSRDAGYSGTPLPRKLGIREGTTVAILGAPDGLEAILGELPPAADLRRDAIEPCDLALAFAVTQAELEARFDAATGLAPAVWVAWPKRTSGVPTELTESVVREHGLARGWVDHKVAAIDATWSGLRFARRKE